MADRQSESVVWPPESVDSPPVNASRTPNHYAFVTTRDGMVDASVYLVDQGRMTLDYDHMVDGAITNTSSDPTRTSCGRRSRSSGC